MKIQFSKILGTNVVSNQAEGVISLVTGVSIDPENGSVIALKCGFKQILTPFDIIKWGKFVHINDSEALTTKENVIRLQTIPKGSDDILYKPVYTESNEFIGRVYDFSIETKAMMLWQIFIKKKFFFYTTFETLIQYKSIVEIKADKIIVKDLHETIKAKTVPVVTA
ncbi:MAG: PRC-barrel domain-containing protein [Candidatus Peregrinibacteria bacterium]|nr:PRC-barrel domain-containing protein [Candidatus Peregrinibacteria bacterium]MDZ4245170.1 PRC-barrel domain-containing protein [Candidatus Gracilibacteria bacterium]